MVISTSINTESLRLFFNPEFAVCSKNFAGIGKGFVAKVGTKKELLVHVYKAITGLIRS